MKLPGSNVIKSFAFTVYSDRLMVACIVPFVQRINNPALILQGNLPVTHNDIIDRQVKFRNFRFHHDICFIGYKYIYNLLKSNFLLYKIKFDS